MYPLFRVAKHLWIYRNAPPLKVGDVHECTVRCWPIDIDIFGEMNNGRFLTLFDLGRIVMFRRMGFLPEMKRRGWYGTVAGTAVRYRRRVTAFQKLRLCTRIIGWDERFTYVEHAMWRGDDCVAQAVLRTAVTSGKGIIPPNEVAEALGFPSEGAALPAWVAGWSDAENARTWPPVLRPLHGN